MAGLPFGTLDEITVGGTTLVLAPHPDDESLGCGGLIAEACARGRPPVVVVLTDGSMSHPSSRSHPAPRLRALRQTETQAAVSALGVEGGRLHFLGLPDGRAPCAGAAMEEAAARVAELAQLYQARAILTTWQHDPHADHVAAYVIGRSAARLAGTRLVSYPVWGWALPPRQRLPVDAVAGARLDIARHLPAKRRAIAAHASQHTGVIADDPNGFHLPASLLSAVDRPFEVFLFER
ncbi:PIG-L family deacetylase [Craurococcus roseus]|uniref:PIG-L family deacetylase n=1 Tax=Craurococcus roseus TaxID=77585 RepID=A0ABP3QMY2_9PROT